MASNSVELIAFDQASKKFLVKEDAVKLLKALVGPVSVVAVCGRARMGKSTLLNQLVTKLTGTQQAKGFVVASTHKPCTKGLHVWSKPIQRTAADGKKMNVLLIDCEGIDAFDQTMDYSTQIFSLGVLLSSLLVFNQMGGIDESAIDKLSSVCEFAKLIQSKSSQGGGSATIQDLSPSFLWLLRDFQFQLTENGQQISTRDYMEETLADMPGTTTAVKNRNQMRSSVKSIFPDRDCFALVRPCLEESDLANMDKLRPEQLRPEFKQGLERLTNLVMAKCQPKQYRGQYISGSALASFAQAYVDVINKGQVPTISSTWQSVMRGENQRALEAALAAYERAFATAQQKQAQPGAAAAAGGGLDLQEQLDAAHAAALQSALEEFDSQALGDASERRGFEAKLKEQAALRFSVVRQARLAEAERRIMDLLQAAGTRIVQLFHEESVDMSKVDAELSAVLQQYDVQAAGPNKYKRAAEFLVNTVVRCLGDVVKKAQAAAATAGTKLQAARKEATEAQGRLTDLSHRVKALDSSESSLKQQLLSAQQQWKSQESEAADKAKALLRSEAKLESLQSDLNEMRQKVRGLEQRAAAAEVQAAQAQGQATQQRGEAARLAAEAEQRARELAGARQEQERRRLSAEAEHGAAAAAAAAAALELSRAQGEAAAAAARREAAEAELASSRTEAAWQLRARDATITQLQAEVQELKQGAVARGNDSALAMRLSQQLSEQEVTVKRLTQEREFLQQQYDSLRRESGGGRLALRQAAPTPVAAAGPSEPVRQEVQAVPAADDGEEDSMEVDEPTRKRRRVAAARTPAAAEAAGTPAAAAVPAGAASPAPFSNERRVVIPARTSPSPAPAAAAVGATPPLPSNLNSLTIKELKDWLVNNGSEDTVFELNNKKPPPKKQDWVDLIKARCAR